MVHRLGEYRMGRESLVAMGTSGFIERIAALEEAHWREPEYGSWRQIIDPAWWVEG